MKSEKKIVDDLAEVMYDSMQPLIKTVIKQRLRQLLPLIKEGLENE
jgi:hypothetical protein